MIVTSKYDTMTLEDIIRELANLDSITRGEERELRAMGIIRPEVFATDDEEIVWKPKSITFGEVNRIIALHKKYLAPETTRDSRNDTRVPLGGRGSKTTQDIMERAADSAAGF